jgi:hypothetical protein
VAASPVDLITVGRAKQNLPSITDTSQDANLQTLVTAASRAVARFCRRDFVSTFYDELYNGTGDRRLVLRGYPVQSVQAVRYRPVTVLKITNTDGTTNQQARASVTGTGLTLLRMASGVKTTDTSVTFAGSPTLTQVAAAVTALAGSWSAQVVGNYGSWPSADLWCPNGSTVDPLQDANAGQGALNAVSGVFAELKMHTFELSGYQVDARRGWLLRAIPYTDPELLHPEDLIWPVGIDNFRIQYTAGYSAVPDDVQEACTEVVVGLFKMFDHGQLWQAQHANQVALTLLAKDELLPPNVRLLLAPYRQFRVFDNQG